MAFQHALDIAKYRLYTRSSTCNTSILWKIPKQVTKVWVMIGKGGFDGSQPITIIPFLMDFRIACNNADLHNGALFGCCSTFCAGLQRVPTTND